MSIYQSEADGLTLDRAATLQTAEMAHMTIGNTAFEEVDTDLSLVSRVLAARLRSGLTSHRAGSPFEDRQRDVSTRRCHGRATTNIPQAVGDVGGGAPVAPDALRKMPRHEKSAGKHGKSLTRRGHGVAAGHGPLG